MLESCIVQPQIAGGVLFLNTALNKKYPACNKLAHQKEGYPKHFSLLC